MRLQQVQNCLRALDIPYTYSENDDCGGIEILHRGLQYHIWEYPAPERGAASNVLNCGRMVDYEGDYEAQIADILRGWKA